MKKSFITIILSIFIIGYSIAQSQIEALRYSQSFQMGTARSISMGGAFGALGGDLSSLTSNPAGISVYRRTEFTITPQVIYNQVESDFLIDKNSELDYKYNFNIANIGVVGSYQTGSEDDWVGVNFAVGYNRLNNFNQNIIIEGMNKNSSMTDFFRDMAGNKSPDELWSYSERLAYDTWLIDKPADEYFSALTTDNLLQYGLTQRKVLKTKGSTGEFTLALGANYANMVYIGGSIGIQNIRYSEDAIYSEFNENPNETDDFRSMRYEEHLDTRGTGFNIKFGMIAKPVYWLRVGMAVHTPTFYSLEEEYTTEMASTFDLPDDQNNTSYSAIPTDKNGYALGPNIFEYEITTPFKAVGSLGFVFGKIGLLSFDVEYLDYSKTRMSADDDDFSDTNDDIKDIYSKVLNFRGGAEFRVGPMSVRGGAAYYTNPYLETTERENAQRLTLAGGIGLSSGSFFCDFGYAYSLYKDTYYFYDMPQEFQLVGGNLNSMTSQFVATFGFRF